MSECSGSGRFGIRTIIEASPSGVVAFNDQGRVAHANREAKKTFGKLAWPGETKCGDFLSCIHRNEVAHGCGHSHACSNCQLLEGIRTTSVPEGAPRWGETLLKRDVPPTAVWIKYKFSPVALDGFKGTLMAIEDVTTQRQTQERASYIKQLLLAIRNVNQLIVQETDRQRLISEVCKKLIETRGYYHAWIVLLDQEQTVTTTAADGLGNGLERLVAQLGRGELPSCGKLALTTSGVVVVEDPRTKCAGCQMASRHGVRGAMAVRLKWEKRIYGVLVVSVPTQGNFDPEEQALIQEVAGDIAFALRNIDLEEERKRFEKAVRESEEKYRALIMQSADCLLLHDLNSKIVDVNPAACDTYGYSREELLRMKVSDLDPDYVKREDEGAFWERFGLNEPYRFEARQRRKDGTIFPVEVTVTKIRMADRIHIMGLCRDITERKLAEETLRKSEEKYRQLIENIGIGVAMISPKMEIVTLNAQMRKWFPDIDPSQRPVCYKAFNNPPGTTPCSYCPTVKTLTDGQVHESITDTPKGNETFHYRVVSSPITDDDGNVVAAIEMVEDITAAKEAEEESKKLRVQLQQAQKMQAIGTLAGGIAHDFNNILTPVMIQTELALLNVSDDSPMKNSLQEVLEASYRAKDLVKQILTFSRQTETQRVPLLLGPIVKEALKLLRSTLPATIKIRQDIQLEMGPVLADPTQIHQILMNLCTNAAHAMRDKGGVLDVTLCERRIDSTQGGSDLHPGKYILLVVRDTGTGIHPKVKENIFDPFYTTKDRSEGTGMGLSVVHGILKSYGGAVSVESEPGKGATFTVFFPAAGEARVENAENGVELPRGNERILVVDDEALVVSSWISLLGYLGYDVTARASGGEALKTFSAQPDAFDMVVTDQTMPGWRGDELARKFKQVRQDVPILLCTGHSDMISEKRAEMMGVDGFIMKPIVMNDAAKTIRQVLDVQGR